MAKARKQRSTRASGKGHRLSRTGLERLIQEEFGFKTNGKPSVEKEVYWIRASRKRGQYPDSTSRSGKWLIFVREEHVDEIWEKIRRATVECKLGDEAKVSTAKPSPDGKPGMRVICVYTYDWRDAADVKRVREELRKLGIALPIPYKADEDTLSGRYSGGGRKRISKYYE